ncbi:MAG: VanZ family protein [Rubrivivax sp.]
MTRGDRSSASTLAWITAALVLYASLYPFSGWRWPAGSDALALLALPWPPWLTPVDEALNFAGYLPLGLLAFVAGVHGGRPAPSAFWRTVLAASLLSYGCEVLQHLLPARHPSLKDWLMNSAGAASGAALGALAHRLGALRSGQRLRQRLFGPGSGGALALLALWPVALLVPTPLPWGLGQLAPRLAEWASALLEGLDAAEDLRAALQPSVAVPASPLVERVAAACGLLAPVLLVYAAARGRAHRAVLAAGALVLGVAAMSLSTLLNFGPAHAWAWLTPAALTGSLAAAALALPLLLVPARLMPALALVVLTTQVVLVSMSGADPYFAQTLQAWEHGRWARLHGVAQWVTWLWPFAAMLWLLMRLGRRP